MTSSCSFAQLARHVDCTTVILFLLVAYLTWKFYKVYDLPPGPWGLPIVGYLPFMGLNPPEETFKELSKKYGNVMSLYFGSTLMVILNNYDLIKEAYIKQGDVFSGRPVTALIKVDENEGGVIVTDGEPWREHRRFILSTFRDYGMGKLSLEPRIQEEIHAFLDELAQQKGRPFDLTSILGMSTANIISTLEIGKRFDYKDERYIYLRNLQDESFDLFTNKNPRPFFPWLEKLPFTDGITNLKRIRQIQKEMKEFMGKIIEEHKSNYNENSRVDLIDAFITERESAVKKNGTEGAYNADEIIGSLLGLYGAGTETTTTTIRWGLLYMMIHPEIQKKVQREIDDVIGLEREPTMSDRNQMVYTEAVLLEIHRCGSLVPLNVPHSNLEETSLGGYRIPKRAVIMTNLWAVHHDPDLWDQPEKFNPERYITKEGKVEKPEYLMPFGIGKRACVGESLAKMEVFLYFTSLLQRFTFQPPEGVKPTLDFESAVARRPKPYKLCAIPRPEYSR